MTHISTRLFFQVSDECVNIALEREDFKMMKILERRDTSRAIRHYVFEKDDVNMIQILWGASPDTTSIFRRWYLEEALEKNAMCIAEWFITTYPFLLESYDL